MKGVRFGNYHSYDDFSLILSQKRISAPSPKTEIIEVPGGDGVLDLTDFFGETKYNNRELEFEFSTIVPPAQFMDLFSQVQNALHGKKLHIVLDDDPDWYYVGRITVSGWEADRNIGRLILSCSCDPYKYKKDETVVQKAVSGSTTFILQNGRKRTVPMITATASMKYEWESYSATVGAGSFVIPELELSEGNNVVIVTGTGTVTFRYQEGGL